MKFLTIKRRTLCVILAGVILVCSVVGVCYAVRAASSPKALYTIVIDAGHGGTDGGAVGVKTKITENEINLEYALSLKSICESFGIKVIMTREDLNGLYSPFASNKKKSDMEKRKEIIDNSQADLVVSVHMNSYPLRSSRGAQVFYGIDNDKGKILAEKVQNQLSGNVEYAKKTAKEGDFYILNCTNLPGILVEFGFLSNVEEESLLINKDYREKLCYIVACGILEFYEM